MQIQQDKHQQQWSNPSRASTDELPIPYRHTYDLNMQPWTTADEVSSRTISCFAPITPAQNKRAENRQASQPPGTIADEASNNTIFHLASMKPVQANRLENKQVSEIPNLCVDERPSQESDKQKNEVATTRVEINKLHCDKEFSEVVGVLSLAAVSTRFEENHNPDKGGNHGIDSTHDKAYLGCSNVSIPHMLLQTYPLSFPTHFRVFQDELPISYRHTYDLNMQPWTTADEVSSRTISCFAPITPAQNKRVENRQASQPPGTIADEASNNTSFHLASMKPVQANRLENKQVSEIPNLCVDERPSQESDKQKNEVATTRVEINELHCDKEFSEVVGVLSLAAVSTRFEENHNPDKGGNHGIDLNKTPQISEIPNLCVDERTSQESDNQKNGIATTRVEVNELHCDKELSQVVGDSSLAAISTTFEENHNQDKGGNHGIDLNKTPQVSEIPNLCLDERLSQESDKQKNEVATTRVEVNELHCDKELSHGVGDSSLAAVSTPFVENHNLDKGGNHVIDLNKTPVSEIPNICVDARTSQESDNQKNEVVTTRVDVNELHSDDELSQVVGDSSLAAVSTPFEDNHNPDKGGNHGINLNKTPQQKPRRKKHRPEVVTEGKSKRTQKPATPKPDGSKENPTGKRKYVRKNGLNKPSTTPPPKVAGEVSDPKTLEPATKSCRRALNFDSNDQARDKNSLGRLAFTLNTGPQEQHFCNGRVQSKSTLQIGPGMEMMVENTQAGIAYDLTLSTKQVLADYMPLPTGQAPSTPPPTNTDPPREKLKADTRDENGTEETGQVTPHDKQRKTVQVLLKSDTHPTPRSPNDSNCSTSATSAEGQETGKKREYSRTIDQANPSATNMIGAQYNSLQAYQSTFQVNEFNKRIAGMHFPEIYKKKRTGKWHNSNSPSVSTEAARIVRSVKENYQKNANADPSDSKANCWASASQFNTNKAPATLGEAIRGGIQDRQKTLECMLAFGQTERLTKTRSKDRTQVRDLALLTGLGECKLLPTLPTKRAPLDDAQGVEILHRPQIGIQALVAENHAKMARTKRHRKRNSVVSSVYNHHKSLAESKGPTLEEIDAVDEQLKRLAINGESNKIAECTCPL